MMRTLLFIGMIYFGLCYELLAQKADFDIKSYTEANKSVTYQEAINIYKALAQDQSMVQVQTFGMTGSGRPLTAIVLDKDGSFDPHKARAQQKNIIMINNGIHPGEPDGIDASIWLVQDILKKKKLHSLLDHAVIVIIPVFNIDGALQRNGVLRATQNGPEEYGFRGNAQNLDLNRDFIKTDTKNALSFQAEYVRWDPDIVIDNHVSNGADYTYTMTILPTHPDKLGYDQGEYFRQQMIPSMYDLMAAHGWPSCPYVNVWGRTPDPLGLPGFLDSPRYLSGYTTLFQSYGFVVETHMLKPYGDRVKATYQFMMSLLEYNAKHYKELRDKRLSAIKAVAEQRKMPISWNFDLSKADTFLFKGYEGEYIKSKVSGLDQLIYNREKPFSKHLPYYSYAMPSKMVEVPRAYFIPQAYEEVILRLKNNDVKMFRFDKDTVIQGETYYFTKLESPRMPYEGHFLHFNIEVDPVKTSKLAYKGDYWIPINQKAKRFIVETLEPQATDSYFAWNFFDNCLSSKEGFNDYVFDDMAAKMIQENPALRQGLNQAIERDSTMRTSAFKQLDWIYRNSPISEPHDYEYPVLRLLD